MLKKLLLLGVVVLTLSSCKKTNSPSAEGAEVSETFVQDNYDKEELTITMRDGIKLHTTIYSPKDKSSMFFILLFYLCVYIYIIYMKI